MLALVVILELTESPSFVEDLARLRVQAKLIATLSQELQFDDVIEVGVSDDEAIAT